MPLLNGRELGTYRMPLVAERYRRDERDLVLRAAPGLTATTLALEVGVVEWDLAAEHVARLALGHRLHELVVDEPGGGVAHSEVAFEGERREAGLGLAEQIDSQEPHGERQLRGVEDGPGSQRSLMLTWVALERLSPPAAEDTVRSCAAARTAKSLRPAGTLQRLLALGLRFRSTRRIQV